jgi:hypothetical protein
MGEKTGAASAWNAWSRQAGWKRVLALTGLGIALTGGLVAVWLLPAPTQAADRLIAGEPQTWSVPIRSEEARWQTWIGPEAWDVRFLGSAATVATAGPWNPHTIHNLTGARPDWAVQDDWTFRSGSRPANLASPYAFCALGTMLAGDLGGGRRSLRIWELPTGRERVALELPARAIERLAFSADARGLAVGSKSGGAIGYQGLVGMTIVDAKTGAEVASLSIAAGPRCDPICALTISANSQTLAVQRGTDRLDLWDVPSSRLRGTIRAETGYQQIAMSDWVFSPDCSSVSTVRTDGAIGVWNAVTTECRFLDEAAQLPVQSRILSFPTEPGIWGSSIALGSGAPRPMAFSADSMTLAVACRDGAVHLRYIPSARLRMVLPAPVSPLDYTGRMLFSIDGRYLAVAGEGPPRTRLDRLPAAIRSMRHRIGDKRRPDPIGRLIVWDLTAGRLRLVAQAGGRFRELAFAPDGSRLAAAREEFFPSQEKFYRGKMVRDVMLWSLSSSS